MNQAQLNLSQDPEKLILKDFKNDLQLEFKVNLIKCEVLENEPIVRDKSIREYSVDLQALVTTV